MLYGLEILHALETRSRVALAEGTLYLILNRLRKDGFVEADWVDAGSGSSHRRKYYRLTTRGSERLRRLARSWEESSAGLDAAVEPVLKPM